MRAGKQARPYAGFGENFQYELYLNNTVLCSFFDWSIHPPPSLINLKEASGQGSSWYLQSFPQKFKRNWPEHAFIVYPYESPWKTSPNFNVVS